MIILFSLFMKDSQPLAPLIHVYHPIDHSFDKSNCLSQNKQIQIVQKDKKQD